MLDPKLQEYVERNKANGFSYEEIKDQFVRGNYCTAEEFDEYLAHQSGKLPRELIIFGCLVMIMILSIGFLFVKLDGIQYEMRESVDALQTGMEQAAQDLKTYTDQRVDTLQLEVNGQVQDLQGDISNLSIDQEQSKAKVDEIVQNVSEQFNQNEQEFVQLKGNLSNIENQVKSVEEELSSFEIASKKSLPAIAKVTVLYDDPVLESFTLEQPSQFGTGFIIDQEGYVVTNKHVAQPLTVMDAIANVTAAVVKLHDGREYTPTLIGVHPLLDVALYKINDSTNFSFIEPSDDELIVGEEVFTLGNPEGFDFSFSAGFVSNTDRVLYDDDGEITLEPPGTEISFIQVDMGVNSGNSGGPLITKEGEIAGVVSLQALSAQGIGFAIPWSTVQTSVITILS